MKDARPEANPARQRGFTLIELLFATLAFALIVLVLKTTLYNAFHLREKARMNLKATLPALQAAGILRRDLQNLAFTGGLMASSLTGQSMGSVETPNDSIEFTCSTGVIRDQEPWPDLQKVQYFLTEPLVLTNAADQGMDLVRAVSRNLLSTTPETPEYQRILSGVQSLEFAYSDGDTWLDAWDSTTREPRVPVLIRARIQTVPQLQGPNQNPRIIPPLELVVPITVQPAPGESKTDATRDSAPQNPRNPGNSQPPGNSQNPGNPRNPGNSQPPGLDAGAPLR